MKRMLFLSAFVAALAAGSANAQHRDGGADHLFGADANNDSAITRAEFDTARDARFAALDANRDGALSRGERVDARDRWRREAPEHRFERADTDNDGAISREEFLARPLALFARLDSNNDGRISETEHRQMRADRETRGEERRGRRRAHQADADHDRQISRAEFSAAGAALFERLDANRDGRIGREETPARDGGHR